MKLKHKLNQSGLVSIISTILIILIITVITLSLSALSRRNLRQALDEQLSTQALYAAESGINDVLAKINANAISDIPTCEKSKENLSTPVSLDPTGNIRYTCVLVDKTPPQINTDVTQYAVKSYPVYAGDGLTISELTFTWKSTNPNANTTFGNCPSNCFEPLNNWGDKLGTLRIRLLPDDGTYASSSLGNTIDIVAYPGNNGESSSFTANNTSRQKLMSGSCSNNACSITVSGLSNGLPGKYYVQLFSYYSDVNVTITGKDNNNTQVNFNNAQATIDSTGAATDVLKRLKVSAPLPSVSSLPPYVLSVGDDICKRFTSNASSTVDVDSINCAAF